MLDAADGRIEAWGKALPRASVFKRSGDQFASRKRVKKS